VYIAVKPAIKAVSEFFGFNDTSLADGLDIAKKAGELIGPVFLVFAGVIAAVAAVSGIAVASVIAIQVAIYALVAAVVYVAAQVVGVFITAWQSVVDFFSGLDLVSVGTNIIDGLVNGLTNAGPNVLKAITGVVSGAIDGAKKLLGIASPSKVFAEIGGYTGDGLAQGVEGATPDVQDAFAAMVEPPDVPTSSQIGRASC